MILSLSVSTFVSTDYLIPYGILVGSSGLEPPTSRLSGARSSLLSYEPVFSPSLFASGGDEEIRTLDPLLAGQVLSQLSYTPRSFRVRTLKIEQRNPSKLCLTRPVIFCRCLIVRWHPLFLSVVMTLILLESRYCLHRKEVIQPHLPIRLPCYDLTPIIEPTFDCCLLAVSSQASGVPDFHGLTGGVYKARERIHRSMLTCDY